MKLAGLNRAMILYIAVPVAVFLVAGAVFTSKILDFVRTPDGPSLVIEEPVFNAGVVAQFTRVKHVFKIENAGSSPLEILRVRTSCGCSVTEISQKVIPPKGFAELALETHIAGRTGGGEYKAFIESNDPLRPVVPAVVIVDIHKGIRVYPRPLFFADAMTWRKSTGKITVQCNPEFAFEVTGVTTTVPFIRAAWSREKAKTPTFRVDVTLDEGAPLGDFREKVYLRTTSRTDAVIELPILGTVKGVVEPLPKKVFAGELPAGTPYAAEVLLTVTTEAPCQMQRVETSSEALKTVMETITPGRQYKLSVSFDAERQPGSIIEEHIVIETDNPLQSTLTIPFVAYIVK